MVEPHAKLRAQIRAARELMGMNQSDIANYMGVSLAKISKAETGKVKSGNTLLEIKGAMESLGVSFTKNGVEYSQGNIETIEGENCYLKLLDDVKLTFSQSTDNELLIMFASDAVSSDEVNERYRFIRKQGAKMRQLIKTGDTFIMGDLSEYRCIPEKYFSNIVTLIYDTKVAQVSGDETKIIIHHDAPFSERERKMFKYFWDTGEKPKNTTATERF